MSENLFNKLLGTPEALTSPTYYEILEVAEGAIDVPTIEEQYKKQIQKVQRFTNNPKYKEGALFIKGELRKARSVLVDEGRRASYQRDLLQQRAAQIRGVLRPLLIKGYLVDEEYKYLAANANRLRVPEPVVQEVIKQELQKKGIDPAQALVNNDLFGKKSPRALPLPAGPQKRKIAAPMTLSARMPWLRNLHPAELFTLRTLAAVTLFPLRIFGFRRPAPPPLPPGHPAAAQNGAGFVSYHPYLSTSLFWVGLAAFGLPFLAIDWSVERKGLRGDLRQREEEILRLREDVQKARRRPVGPSESVDAKVHAAKLRELRDELVREQARVADLERQIKETPKAPGGEELARLKRELDEARTTLARESRMVKLLEREQERLERDLKAAQEALKTATPGGDAELKKAREELQRARERIAKGELELAAQKKAGEIEIEQLRKAMKDANLDPDRTIGRILASDHKTVTLALGTRQGVKKGDRFDVKRIEVVGEIEIVSVTATGSTGKVVRTEPNVNVVARDTVIKKEK